MKTLKKIFFLSLLLTSLAARSQTYQPITNPGTTGLVRGALVVQGMMWIANDTLPVPVSLRDLPGIAGKGDSLYRWSPVQHRYIFVGGGGASVWGSISGTLSNQTDLQNALNSKQNKLTQGTSSQYFKGDLSLGTFSTDVLNVTNGLYSPLGHTHLGLLPAGGATSYVLRKNSGADYDVGWYAFDASAFVPLTQFYDSLAAHWAKISNMGFYAKGPHLIGIPGQNVGDKDTLALDNVWVNGVDEAVDKINNLNLTFPDISDLQDSIAGNRIASFSVSGTYSKTATIELNNGYTYDAPFIDLTGGGFGRTYYNGWGLLKPNDSTFVVPNPYLALTVQQFGAKLMPTLPQSAPSKTRLY